MVSILVTACRTARASKRSKRRSSMAVTCAGSSAALMLVNPTTSEKKTAQLSLRSSSSVSPRKMASATCRGYISCTIMRARVSPLRALITVESPSDWSDSLCMVMRSARSSASTSRCNLHSRRMRHTTSMPTASTPTTLATRSPTVAVSDRGAGRLLLGASGLHCCSASIADES
eukprot:3293604-Rhodomonas_salina.2